MNLFLAVMLMIFVLVVGPTATLMRDLVQNIGLYLDSLLLRTFNIYAYEPRPWIDTTGPGGFPGRPSSACSSRGYPADVL